MVVIGILGIVIAFFLLLGYVRAVAWMRESKKTRFAFEDRDTYLFLKVDRPLGTDETALVTMRTLREALRLKLRGAGYERVMVELSSLRIANKRAFWILVGALGPALTNQEVKVAVVCKRRTPAAKHFAESEVLNPFPSERDAARYLKSAEPRQVVALQLEETDSFLATGGRRAA